MEVEGVAVVERSVKGKEKDTFAAATEEERDKHPRKKQKKKRTKREKIYISFSLYSLLTHRQVTKQRIVYHEYKEEEKRTPPLQAIPKKKPQGLFSSP